MALRDARDEAHGDTRPSTSVSDLSPPVLLSFHDLTYGIHVNGKYRTLLRGITGFAESGSLLAVLGPSGSGKTTLLDVLAGRRTRGLADGAVRFNGRPLPQARYRCERGYVQQEDLFCSYLSVEETIRFAAVLRTPSSFDDEAIEVRVRRVIDVLGLDNVRHSRMGSSLVRGVSGGEKKRCSVAAELVTAPSLLLLDEPTTGLDTFTAWHLLCLLRSLARSGMAIVLSIHQPRASIFELFDRVLLLNEAGEQAYFGAACEAVSFLESLGIHMPCPQNPADFLLDAVSVVSTEEVGADATSFLHDSMVSTSRASLPAPTQGRDIAAAFRAVRLPRIEAEVEDRLLAASRAARTPHSSPRFDDDDGDGDGNGELDTVEIPLLPQTREASGQPACTAMYFRSTWTQIRVVATRCVLNTMRDPIATIASTAVAVLFALLIGSIYYRVGNDQESIRSRMGVLFFVMMNTTFSSLGNLDAYLTGRALYSREHSNGMYSAAAYYVGKAVQDVPFGVLVNTAFNAIVYIMVGLQPSWYRFACFDVVCVLVMLNSYALCLLVSNVAKNYATANICASLILVLYLLPTGGMLVSLDKIPVVWRWIKYVSFVRYAFGALVANEFTDLVLICPGSDSAARETDTPSYPCIRSGTVYASSLGFYEKDALQSIAILAVSFTVYMILGYLVLRFWRSVEQ